VLRAPEWDAVRCLARGVVSDAGSRRVREVREALSVSEQGGALTGGATRASV